MVVSFAMEDVTTSVQTPTHRMCAAVLQDTVWGRTTAAVLPKVSVSVRRGKSQGFHILSHFRYSMTKDHRDLLE